MAVCLKKQCTLRNEKKSALPVSLLRYFLPRQTQRPQRILGKLIQVVLTARELRQVLRMQPLLNDRVRSLAEQNDAPVHAANDAHALAHIVEVKDVEDVVRPLLAHHLHGYGLGRAAEEDEAKVARRRHQRRLVRRLGLVRQHVVLHLGHDGVAHAQECEEAVHVLLASGDRVAQRLVVEAEALLVVLIPGEVEVPGVVSKENIY